LGTILENVDGALHKEPKVPGGRHPFNYVMMLKILILQQLSSMRAPGLALCSTMPDEKTIMEKQTVDEEAGEGSQSEITYPGEGGACVWFGMMTNTMKG
jgi:hypothetical protein